MRILLQQIVGVSRPGEIRVSGIRLGIAFFAARARIPFAAGGPCSRDQSPLPLRVLDALAGVIEMAFV